MNPSPDLKPFLNAAQHCAMQLMFNAQYIRSELPSLELSDELRKEIHELCDSWTSSKHDVISQLFDVEEIQEQGAEQAELMSACDLALKWLDEDIGSTHEVIQKLEQSGTSLAWMLVMESATNIIEACSAAHDARAAVFGGGFWHKSTMLSSISIGIGHYAETARVTDKTLL